MANHLVDLEAQAVEIQAQIAAAHRQAALQTAANQELESALRLKIEALNATRAIHPAAGMITEREAMAAVEAKLRQRMSYT